MGIIGANGLGKSTLLKIAVGRLQPDAGEVRWGYEARTGYFPQDHKELLDQPDATVLEYLWSICPREPTSFVRGQLGRLLFSGEEVDKKVRSLSGGEAARLIFSRLVVEKPNVLVLDEPTNHLDLEAIEALAAALVGYDGTLLFVSHDRWFVSRVASRIVEVTADGIIDYPGSYQDYVSRDGADHLDADAVAEQARRERALEREQKGLSRDWEEQKRRRGEHQRMLKRRDAVTEEIAAAESRLEVIRALYCEPGFFEETPADRVAELQEEEAGLGPRLEALMSEWEALETALEALGEV
jgi:ABC-type glutathione transport system ATPase component